MRDFTRPFRRMGRRIKREFKSKYGKLKIFIIALGLVIVTAAGVMTTGILHQFSEDTYKPIAAEVQTTAETEATTTSPEATKLIEATEAAETEASATETTETEAKEAGSAENSSNNANISNGANKGNESTEDNDKNASNKLPDIEQLPDDSANNQASQAEETTTIKKVDWLEKRIDEHRDEIDTQDLQDFRAITAKLEQGYIQSIYNGGINENELVELRDYLNSALSVTEYNRAKQLFATYNYLLEEE